MINGQTSTELEIEGELYIISRENVIDAFERTEPPFDSHTHQIYIDDKRKGVKDVFRNIAQVPDDTRLHTDSMEDVFHELEFETGTDEKNEESSKTHKNAIDAWYIGFNDSNNWTERYWWNLFKDQESISLGYPDVDEDLSEFEDADEIKEVFGVSGHKANQLERFVSKSQIGDVIFAKDGMRGKNDSGWSGNGKILAIGVISGEYVHTSADEWYDDLPEQCEGSKNNHHRSVDWIVNFETTAKGSFKPDLKIQQGTIYPTEYNELKSQILDSYDLADDFEQLEKISAELRTKAQSKSSDGAESQGQIEPAANPPGERELIAKQLIDTGQLVFYGPPGTGKTYTAQQFARWWITQQTEGPTRTEQLELTTFHPSFSYEDFIEGLTAKARDGAVEYIVEPGVFKEICKRAEQAYRNSDSPETAPPYVLIIDEINRGNLAQIFGELMTLLEVDKRLDAPNETRSSLAHSNESFVVPPNLFIIGTMNTADESIALLDAALRRRFRFYGFPPDFEKISTEYGIGDAETVVREGGARRDQLISASILGLTELNTRIRGVNQLGKGKQLGHTHLYGHKNAIDVRDTWRFDILPQLEDYYFGKFDRLKDELFHNVAVDLIEWDAEQIGDFLPESLYRDLCAIAGITEYAPLAKRLETDGAKQETTVDDAWAAGKRTPNTFKERIEQNAESPLRERLIELWEIGDGIGRLDAGRGEVMPSVSVEIPEFSSNVGFYGINETGKFNFKWNWLIGNGDLTREDVESFRPILETIDSYWLKWEQPDDQEKDPEYEYPYLYLDKLTNEEFDQLTKVVEEIGERIRTEITNGEN